MMKRVLFSTLALSFGLSIQAQFTTQISPSHEGGQWFFGVGVGIPQQYHAVFRLG